MDSYRYLYKSIISIRCQLPDEEWWTGASMKIQYVAIVVNGNQPEDMGVSEALDLYETFHYLDRKDFRGAVPWSCSCVNNHKHCVQACGPCHFSLQPSDQSSKGLCCC